ncbi:MAG: flagellar M-ring protein FliF C-terminal domain-containing protein [Candidatus Gastranaerophilaceae bacterium]
MDFQKLLENKALLYGIAGGVFILLGLFITVGIISSSHNANKGGVTVTDEPIKEDVDLLTTDNLGKAIEIQALLAKHDIAVSRKIDGTKSILYLKKGDCTTGRKKCTTSQRDEALIQIVQSGLMDQNVGLEIFDKGDFTSTKEDKKIRLARAINGELSRLIRRIKPIENASVFISIPEQSMFTSMQKPVTATVQVTIPSDAKLDQTKIKAITNLLLGSVTGLTAENIAITDTNGNTYHSIMDAEDEMLQKIEENDKYMTGKVQQQLDRLIGKGNYVATVSTFLRQAPVEKYTIDYDPNRKTAVNEQSFTEGLGDRTTDSNKGVNAVSVYLPNGLPANGSDSSQNRNYSRQATETQYGVTKTQTNEYIKPGVIEEISIAITLDKNALPANTTLEELKELIAHAASPKVSADNVSIAFSDSNDPYLMTDKPSNLPKPDETGNPWWLAIAVSGVGLLIVFKAVSDKVKKAREESLKEVEMLRQKTAQQEQQLSAINQQAAQLTERQSELAQGLLEQQQREFIPQQNPDQLIDTLSHLSAEISDADDEEAAEKIKSWIEQG